MGNNSVAEDNESGLKRICRIVVADDCDLFRQTLRLVLSQAPDFRIVGEAADGMELLELLRRDLGADVIILDLSMPRLGGIETMREVRRVDPHIKVLVVTMHKDVDHLLGAIAAGADGYLLKEYLATEAFPALDAILQQNVYISTSMLTELRDTRLKVHIAIKGSGPQAPLTSRQKRFLELFAGGGARAEKRE